MRVDWQILKSGDQQVEVQFFAPDGPSMRLVVFCPGFPGRGGTMFEQRHAAALVEHGFTVAVIKHAGTRIDGPDAPFMINNGARLMRARQNNEHHLGGGPSTVRAWLDEPAILLQILRDAFPRIDIIGNSFGAVSALWSLTRPDAPVDKIGTLLLFAGAQGVDSDPLHGIMRLWNPMFLSAPAIWEKITLDTPLSINATMREAYAEIAAKAANLPASIALKYLVVTADELLKVADSEHFRDKVMGGRGELVLDTLDRAYPSHGLLAHDTPDYPTEKLLELLQ